MSADVSNSSESAPHLDPEYCGECFGAPAPSGAIKAGCCNTCAEVREAYASVSWSFGRGENVEQCEREHYAEHLDQQRREGCRLDGLIRVNKVVGNFHFAPGKSFSNGNMHVHDLENYFKDGASHSFSHTIHELRFGPQLPNSVASRIEARQMATKAGSGVGMPGGGAGLVNLVNPLDNMEQKTDEKAYNYMYFIKVVSTAYLPLGWESKTSKIAKRDENALVQLGKVGIEEGGLIETHQYSVTSHKRSLSGGSDSQEGHAERLHARGGIPGVFFSYVSSFGLVLSCLQERRNLGATMLTRLVQDISPMKVINREVRAKTFSSFLVSVCAVVGGTLTVAAAVDRALYEGNQRLKKLHQG